MPWWPEEGYESRDRKALNDKRQRDDKGCNDTSKRATGLPTMRIGSRVRSMSRMIGSRRKVMSMYDSPGTRTKNLGTNTSY